MKKLTKKPSKIARYPRKADDVFVTQKMLYKVRDEVKEHSSSLFHEVKSDIHAVRSEIIDMKSELKSEIHGFRSEIDGIKSDIQVIKSDIQSMKSEIKEIKSSVHRIELLVEEQNNRNKIVIDGLTQLFSRQDRLENNFAELKR